MAFDVNNLEYVTDQTPEQMLWKYTTTDTLATVQGTNYFLPGFFINFRRSDLLAVEANDGKKLYKFGDFSTSDVVINTIATVSSFNF